MMMRNFALKLARPSFKAFTPKLAFNQVTKLNVRNLSAISIETAKALPRNYNEMPNDVLLTMAVMGDQEAREERLIREIMAVDNVTWKDAQPIFQDIVSANRSYRFLATLPYKFGITLSLTAAFVSIPMIFEVNTVLWFNEVYVTADIPEPKDLETPLEVGSFAWSWMEPPLGHISFFLLCMQYARSQLENLGVKPYTGWYKARRAQSLIKQYPQYHPVVVASFSEGDPLQGDNDFSEVK